MASKIFAGRLPYSMTDEQLAELFAPHGTVEKATIIFDRSTGQSKGFGFVEMSTEEEAQAAINALNNSEVDGRQIVASPARPPENRPPRRDFGPR